MVDPDRRVMIERIMKLIGWQLCIYVPDDLLQWKDRPRFYVCPVRGRSGSTYPLRKTEDLALADLPVKLIE